MSTTRQRRLVLVIVLGKFLENGFPVPYLLFDLCLDFVLDIKIFFGDKDRFTFLRRTTALLWHNEIFVEMIVAVCFREGTTNRIYKTIFTSRSGPFCITPLMRWLFAVLSPA